MPNAVPPRKILEVIVNSLDDALEAEAGGADRLEVVRDLALGGLTPDLSLVATICASVSIPVRVMLRENPSMHIASTSEMDRLRRHACAFSQLAINGLVLGFVANNNIDRSTLHEISNAAPHLKFTFHRAFDTLPNVSDAICILKAVSAVDRILTTGGPGSWPARKARLHHWQRLAGPQIKIMAGAGLEPSVITDLMSDPFIQEVHIGRAARNPCDHDAPVCRLKVAALKGLQA